MAPRYPANPNRVTLDFDPVTSDALTAAAKQLKTTRQRLSYEVIQAWLRTRMATPAAAPEVEDDHTRSMRAGIDAIRNFRPGG